ncbi:MAG: hypothetical protein ACN6OJ_09675 [Chryseobacterium sp.]
MKTPEDLDYDYLEKLYENKIFEDYKCQIIASRKYEEIKISTDKLTFKLIDKEQRDTVSLVHGEIRLYNGIEYFQIIWTYSKFPKQGYLSFLFDLLIYEFGLKLISDEYHTSPGSKEFWQSLMRKKKYKIFRLNLETNYKKNANKYDEKEIWGAEENFNSMELLNNWNINILEENNELENFDEDIEYNDEVIDNILLGIDKDKHQVKSKNISKRKIRLVAQGI